MISKQLLEMLVCPENRTPLQEADQQLLARVNAAISAGRLVNRSDQKVEKPLDGGLIREDGAVMYPVADGIPVMLVDESIPLDQETLSEGS